MILFYPVTPIPSTKTRKQNKIESKSSDLWFLRQHVDICDQQK